MTRPAPHARTGRPFSPAPSLLLGLGYGGFIDGIVLHQILQWHHMISHTRANPVNSVSGLEANTVADGLFHAGAWLLLLAGTTWMVASWRRGTMAPSWPYHLGLMLVGWGIFNLVEGTINHHVLGVHHVRDDLGAPLAWDLGFLALGALLVGIGWLVHRAGRADQPRDQT